jgi:hypothetical protein
MKNKIAIIHELVEAYDLRNKARDRGLIYKRAYLYHELRTSGFSLSQIGEIFGKHHATIIHGLRTHENLTGYNDEDYKHETFQLKKQLEGSVLIFPEQKNARKADLKADIIEARTIRDFKRIRRRVKLGVYEKVLEQCNFIES